MAAQRLTVLTSHLSDLQSELPIFRAKALFSLSTDRLQYLSSYMEVEMQKGLSKDGGSTLAMIPSFVYKPKGTRSHAGIFYALDLGGTNFRVLRLAVSSDGKLVEAPQQHGYVVSSQLMSGPAEDLFDFIGKCVAKFVEPFPKDQTTLGFTFSFPVRQRAIAEGELLNWTKGFTCSGMESKNIVELLQNALTKNGVGNLKVAALCNDTVGTLIARYVGDSKAHIGVILGTGSNACYWEKSTNISKEPTVLQAPEAEMVVNIEWGNLASDQKDAVLPLTYYDVKLDEMSPNTGKQLFEKMISGMYLGELVRLVLLDVIPKSNPLYAALTSVNAVSSKLVSEILSDDSLGLRYVQQVLALPVGTKDQPGGLGVNVECFTDRRRIKDVCLLIRDRSASLSAAAVAAILKRTRRLNEETTVAVDGSVYEKIPGYKNKLGMVLREVFGVTGVELVLSKDGSGIGAGMIAAIVG